MTRILAARHGQTQWNLQNKVCGRTDQLLTEEGQRQAEALADRLKDFPIDVILVSPLLRARQTAGAVAERRGIPVVVDSRLIEQDYGIYEGVDRQDPDFLANKRQFAVRYPGGESMMDVAHRVYSLLQDVKTRWDGKTVLLVCHGGVCRVLRTYFRDMTNQEFFHYSPENASFEIYEL